MAFICNDTSTTEIYTYCHTLSLHDALPICLELPAGLVGDETTDEAPEVSAARELEEETGYRAGKIENLGFFYASPGMVSERSEEHTSELQSLMRISYAVFCLKKNNIRSNVMKQLPP